MKKFYFIISCFFITSASQAQILNQIGGKAKEKLNAQDFNTTRSNRERGMGLAPEQKQSSKEQAPNPAPAPAPSESQPEENMESGSSYESVYKFNVDFVYKFEKIEKNTESFNIHYAFGDNCVKMEYLGDDAKKSMTSILDSKNNSMIMIDKTNNTATIMPKKYFEMAQSHQAEKAGDTPKGKVTKTGRTKIILGYTCYEYLIESSSKTEVWITNDANVNINDAFLEISKNYASSFPDDARASGGLMMEMFGYDKDGKQSMHLIMTELNKKESSLNLGTYKITEM